MSGATDGPREFEASTEVLELSKPPEGRDDTESSEGLGSLEFSEAWGASPDSFVHGGDPAGVKFEGAPARSTDEPGSG